MPGVVHVWQVQGTRQEDRQPYNFTKVSTSKGLRETMLYNRMAWQGLYIGIFNLIHLRYIRHKQVQHTCTSSVDIMEAFKADIQNSVLIRYPKRNATELAQQYDSDLHTLINLHALLVSKKISLKPPNPWMTPAILASKRYHRYLECVWRRNPTALNRPRLTRQAHLCNRQTSKAKSADYSKIIAEHCGDYGSLWKAFNKLLQRCLEMHLPYHSSIAALANTFSSFFINKISDMRSYFPSDSHSRVLNPPDTRKVLQNLSCVTAHLSYGPHASPLI